MRYVRIVGVAVASLMMNVAVEAGENASAGGAETCRRYVNASGGNVSPYATPETAAHNLADALSSLAEIDPSVPCEIEVAKGRYTVPPAVNKDEPWVRVSRPVRIYSKEGPKNTIFDGGWNGTASTPVCFAFILDNAKCSLEGFTILNLYSETTYSKNMGGAIHAIAGTVSNCVIRKTSNNFEGPLSLLDATACHCEVYDNETRDAGAQGGVTIRGAGKLCDSLIADNDSKEGVGLYLAGAHAIVSNCVIRGNTCQFTSRGNYGALVVSDGLLTDSIVSNNVGMAGVVKVRGTGEVRNCLIVDNTSVGEKASGGGVTVADDGLLENCTVVGNVATKMKSGQGVLQTGGTVRNCVIACNGEGKAFANSDNFTKSGGTVEYSCVYPLADGTANISKEPGFCSTTGPTAYCLGKSSPCRNAGTHEGRAWMVGAKDLGGNARVIGGEVDMGCFEYVPKGLVLFMGL